VPGPAAGRLMDLLPQEKPLAAAMTFSPFFRMAGRSARSPIATENSRETLQIKGARHAAAASLRFLYVIA